MATWAIKLRHLPLAAVFCPVFVWCRSLTGGQFLNTVLKDACAAHIMQIMLQSCNIKTSLTFCTFGIQSKGCIAVLQVTCPKCWGTTPSRPVTETSCLFTAHPAPPSPSSRLSMEGEVPWTPSSALRPTRPSWVLITLGRMIDIVPCPLHYR